MDPIVVIGAGAAGIMAARRAAELGSKVLLLEKTPRLGTKILISGGGKCNITHDGEIEDVLRAFRQNEARFIRPSCYRFTNKQIVKVLTDRGLRVYTRPDGRIFPVDQTAKDVVSILRRYLDEVGVTVRFNAAVASIENDGIGVSGVRFGGSVLPTRRVILAVGGSSYPNSGTTGDGFAMAEALGHRIVRIRAALAPIKLRGDRWTPFSGIAFRDCVLRARQNGKEIAQWRGDTLITHHGLSGPCTLGISRAVAEARERGPV
ncbi:MAG: aminoacetone oxidase family FAD-binding enzyme, partial [Fimbriimonadales bacterium]